jgi:MYXO-CTERM domain-containing protein
MIRRAIPTLALGTVLLLAGDAAAWTAVTSPPSVWTSSDIPVPWYLNEAGSDDLGPDVTEREVMTSFDHWEDVDCCRIAFEYRGRVGLTAYGSRDITVVSWSESGWRYDPSAIAVTSNFFGYGTIDESDIDCNGVYLSWNTTGGGGGVDTQSILTHEIGHVVGLGDLYDRAHESSTMYGVYSGGTDSRSLAEDDMEGCRALYEEYCAGCATDDECPDGYRCRGDACVPNPPSGGGMCSACATDADCTGGRCVTGFPAGDAFCGIDCPADGDCGDGNTCFEAAGIPDQCLPADLDCGRPPGGCLTDADCVRHGVCRGGACLPAPPGDLGDSCGGADDCDLGLCLDGVCSAPCWPWEPDACGDGFHCDTIACGLWQCRPGAAGAGGLFASCTADTDCRSGACETVEGATVCVVPCDPYRPATCPSPMRCQPVDSGDCGICNCNAGLLGERCRTDSSCQSGRCLAADPESRRRCTSDCVDGRCPAGATCRTVTPPDAGSIEQCVGDLKAVGEDCAGNGECQTGICWTVGAGSVCTQPCGGPCGCPYRSTCRTDHATGLRLCLPGSSDEGCECAVPGSGRGGPAALVLLLLLAVRRRRG